MTSELAFPGVVPPPDHPMLLGHGEAAALFRAPAGTTFTVSARGKPPGTRILDFLAAEFAPIPASHVESVFGFVEACTLYGGRPFVEPELSEDDVATLEDCSVGIRLPLSNHHVTRGEYERYTGFLGKYHRAGNSVIVHSNDLGRWVREDFPRYEIEASVIKEIDTHEKIARALEIHDAVVLPMRMNLDLEFLEAIEEKNRVTLFANAGCALTCPAKICYPAFSKANKLEGGSMPACSFSKKPRELYGMVDFDLEKLAALGFRRFKVLRMRDHGLTGF